MFSNFRRALSAATNEFRSSQSDFRVSGAKIDFPSKSNNRDLAEDYLVPDEEVLSRHSCDTLRLNSNEVNFHPLVRVTGERLLFVSVAGYDMDEFRFADVKFYSFKEMSPTKQHDKKFQLFLSAKYGRTLSMTGQEGSMTEFFDCIQPNLIHATRLED